MVGVEEAADALWRAAVYASVCQLHLRDNVLLTEPLVPEHVKTRPSGHWGTVPGTAWALTHISLAAAEHDDRSLIPLLGAGHAGVVQLAFNWLTGDLAGLRAEFTPDASGLTALSAKFPDVDGLGAEVSPGLFAGDFLGGRLGGCLPFAQGAALDAPDRILLPIIGDGECETPTTAASWMAHAAMTDAKVLPIVHLNGFRMGAPSLLSKLGDQALKAWAAGQGWSTVVATVTAGGRAEHAEFHEVLVKALAAVDGGQPTILILRCRKGWGGPEAVGGKGVLDTPSAHKTPLTGVGEDEIQREQLCRWLASYRPAELFDADGRPRGVLAEALARARWDRLTTSGSHESAPPVAEAGVVTFTEAVQQAVQVWAGRGSFRVFSPDELESNRLGALVGRPFVREVLAEEVLLEWLAGWTASGRRGVLISYEAFASLLVPGLIGHLKQRRLASCPDLPSLNVLLTSYGWHNTYTHGDPSAATALLGCCDPAIRVLTPSDPPRLAAALHACFASVGAVNVIIAGKHDAITFPAESIGEEQRRGLAVWPHLSDVGEPDLTIVAAGDLAVRTVAASLADMRARFGCRIRIVNVADLTVLGPSALWPRGFDDSELDHYLGPTAAVLIVTLGHPSAVWGLLQGRLSGRRVEVIGWREPPGPLSQHALAEHAGLSLEGVAAAAGRLLAIPGGVPR